MRYFEDEEEAAGELGRLEVLHQQRGGHGWAWGRGRVVGSKGTEGGRHSLKTHQL